MVSYDAQNIPAIKDTKRSQQDRILLYSSIECNMFSDDIKILSADLHSGEPFAGVEPATLSLRMKCSGQLS